MRQRYITAHLVALAVVLQAARSFAVAAFAVPAVWLALFAFTDFRFEGLWVPVQTRLRENTVSPSLIRLREKEIQSNNTNTSSLPL